MADTAATLNDFQVKASEITQNRPAEELSKEDIDNLVNLVDDLYDDACDAEGVPSGGAGADAKMLDMSMPDINKKVSDIKNKLIWATLHKLFGAGVAETEKQWAASTPVHLKIDELETYLEKYNLGMCSAMLYHCSGNDERAVVSYAINGITRSRFSHATCLMPLPDHPGLPVLWQSAHACEGKLGGGKTRNGPDLADLKAMIKEYYRGWPSSRFVFRPINKPLDEYQQKKALAYVDKILADKNMTFPSMTKLYWTWILSSHPKYAALAYLCGFDGGVEHDNFNTMFCSQTVTATLLAADVLGAPIKQAEYSPAAYGKPYDQVAYPTEKDKIYGEEYEFIFDDLVPQPAH